MAGQVVFKGLDKVLGNLNKEIKKIDGRTLKGLIRAAIIIRRDMETTPPLIPVDTGNLRASYFTITTKGTGAEGMGASFKGENAGKMAQEHSQVISEGRNALQGIVYGPAVMIGFTAYYAFKVHEDMMSHFKRPGSGPKFLESAIERNKDKILSIIREEAKIK